MAALTNLSSVPSDLSLDYFKDVEITTRAKERGYNFFVNGYVHGIRLYNKTEDSSVDLAAKCYKSMKKNEMPHRINFTINVQEKKFTERHCSCQAGISGTCSHAMGTIFQLIHFKNLGLTDVPSELSCTSMPQQWGKPRGPKINPEPVSSMVFAKPKQKQRKKKPVQTSLLSIRIPDVKPEEVKRLKTEQAAVGTPLQYLLQEDVQMVETDIGLVQLGSLIPYQLKNIQPGKEFLNGHTPCGNTTFPTTTSIFDPQTISKYNNINTLFGTSIQDAIELERKTFEQASCAQWFKERNRRITASQFAKVCKRKKEVTAKFVDSIFTNTCFQSEATSYGKSHENVAKQVYMEKHHNDHIHDCGIIVNPSYSYLAATPDGKICVNGETGVLEVKCPFLARDLTIADAVRTIPNFCLEASNDSYTLRKCHDYFYQVQGQLMISGAPFCSLIVYTKKDLHHVHVQRISLDNDFVFAMFEKLSAFFQEHHPNIEL